MPRSPGSAVRKLLVVEADRAYCQPCLSPVWDTGLAGHAMAEAGADTDAACAWLRERQILDVVGDWAVRRPGLRPGGWAFQYANPHYPDVDDTAVVGMLLHRNGDPAYRRGDRARPRVDHRHAVIRRRLGRIRAGEHASLSQQHSVRRSWRAARSADRRRDRALRLVPGADRHGGGRSGAGAGAGVSASRAGGGRKLVRPLGHQLHLRHLVGAVRVQRGRRRRRRSGGAAGGGVAALRAARRRRLGRGRGNLPAMHRMAATRRARRARRPGRCSV